jgi:hypothetical protein
MLTVTPFAKHVAATLVVESGFDTCEIQAPAGMQDLKRFVKQAGALQMTAPSLAPSFVGLPFPQPKIKDREVVKTIADFLISSFLRLSILSRN